MPRAYFTGLPWLIAAVALAQGSGCTLIGLGIGAAVDARKPNQSSMLPGWQVETVKPGTPMTLSLQDSSRVNGTYRGLEYEPARVYAHRYAKSREQQPEGKLLPTLEDRITVTATSGKQSDYEFVGFDYRRIWPSSSARLQVLLRRPRHTQFDAVDLRTVSKVVDSQGTVLEAPTISQMFAEGRLPLLSAIVITQDGEKIWVAIDQVASIAVPVKKQGKRIGAGIGATVDGVVVVLLVSLGVYWLLILATNPGLD